MDVVSRWFALQVRPNYERVSAELLRQKGYEEFVPVYSEWRKRSDRDKRIDLPLFPGYVFCRCAWQPRLRRVDGPGVLSTPGVLRILGFGKQAAPLADEEMDSVRQMVHSGLGPRPCSYFESGQPVCLVEGPLRGLKGQIIQVKGTAHLAVLVTLLQRSISVEIDSAWACGI